MHYKLSAVPGMEFRCKCTGFHFRACKLPDSQNLCASCRSRSIDFRFEILDYRIEALTPRINSGGKFLGYRFFISGRMNPGACILDAFGQTHHRFHNYLLWNIVTALTVTTFLIVATLAFIVLCRMTNAPAAESVRPKTDTSHRLLSWRTQNFRLLFKLPDSSVE